MKPVGKTSCTKRLHELAEAVSELACLAPHGAFGAGRDTMILSLRIE